MPIGVTVVLRRMGRVPKARPQPPKSFPLKHNQECKRQAPSFSLRRLQAEPGTCLGTESAPGLGWALRRTPRTVSLAPRTHMPSMFLAGRRWSRSAPQAEIWLVTSPGPPTGKWQSPHLKPSSLAPKTVLLTRRYTAPRRKEAPVCRRCTGTWNYWANGASLPSASYTPLNAPPKLPLFQKVCWIPRGCSFSHVPTHAPRSSARCPCHAKPQGPSPDYKSGLLSLGVRSLKSQTCPSPQQAAMCPSVVICLLL